MFHVFHEYLSKSSIHPFHLVLKQINMILFYPQSFVTWFIRCHYDSYELWPLLNEIIPHVHYRGCVGCWELSVYSVTTSVCIITAQASFTDKLHRKENASSYITGPEACGITSILDNPAPQNLCSMPTFGAKAGRKDCVIYAAIQKKRVLKSRIRWHVVNPVAPY